MNTQTKHIEKRRKRRRRRKQEAAKPAELVRLFNPIRNYMLVYAEKINDEALLQRLRDPAIEFSDEEMLQALRKKIKGSATQAYIANTILCATSFIVLPSALQLARKMPQLNAASKMGLLGMPSVTASFSMVALASQLDRNSGIKPLMVLRALSQMSQLALTVITATIDPTDIPIPLAYTLIAGSAFQMACFVLSSNLINWTPGDTAPILGKYAAIASMAPSALIALLQLVGDEINLAATFGFILGISFLGNFAGLAVRESPYHQLAALGVPTGATSEIDVAKELARHFFHQDKFPLPSSKPFLRALFETAYDRRALAICSGVISSYGVFLLLTTSTAEVLSHLDFTPANAAYTASGMAFLAMLVRYFSGKPLSYDARGVKAFLAGSACTLSGALMAASARPSPNVAYALSALTLVAVGVGITAPAAFKLLVTLSGAEPLANMEAYRIGTMNAFIAFVGQLSGFGLNAINAGIVSRESTESYYDTFYLITSLALVSSAIIALTEISLKKPMWCTFHRPAAPSVLVQGEEFIPLPTFT